MRSSESKLDAKKERTRLTLFSQPIESESKEKSLNKLELNQVESFKQACFSQGTPYLQHQTKINSLPAILNNGFILPRNQQSWYRQLFGGGIGNGLGNGNVAYLQSYHLRNREHYSFYNEDPSDTKYLTHDDFFREDMNAVLLFRVDLLTEYNDYYFNIGWTRYGGQHEDSLLPQDVVSHPRALRMPNEICFKNPIDLAYLEQIWVHSSQAINVVKLLNDENVDETWIEKIVTPEFHPATKEGIDR